MGVSGDEDLPVMPDLTRPRYGFSHTADSALTSLSRMGIAPERITVKSGGPGWRGGRVVEQEPKAGTVLTSDKPVQLTVGGEGLFHYLPTGMRDEPSARQLGVEGSVAVFAALERVLSVRKLTALFDDPVEKAAYFVRQAGLYFDVRPENAWGCARWIRLFGVEPDEWPREVWGRLAALLPWLHVLAGTETGLRLALKLLLDLDLKRIGWTPRVTRLGAEQLSVLGQRASQLGVDIVVGDGLEDEAAMRLTLGPVSLEAYGRHQSEKGLRDLARALRLVVPCHLEYEVDWLVGDDTVAPRLGEAGENSVLGINSHLGWKATGAL